MKKEETILSKEFKATFSDLQGLSSKNLEDSSFVATVKDENSEVWFGIDARKQIIIVKIPRSKSGFPENYEFTVTQFKNIIQSGKKKDKSRETQQL